MIRIFTVSLACLLAACNSTPQPPLGLPCAHATEAPKGVPKPSHACGAVTRPPSSNPLGVLFIWGERNNFWPKDQVLRVRFMDGNKTQIAKAWERFERIDKMCGITFVRVEAPETSEIRVSFNQLGHWSYVGRGNLSVPQNQPTMNLELMALDSAKEWDRVALHEIFHALGFNHELQHPSAQIPWDKKEVYLYYEKYYGWDKAMTDRQVLERYSGPQFKGTGFDPASIMAYPVMEEHTIGDYYIGWNSELSPCDIYFLRETYPLPETETLP